MISKSTLLFGLTSGLRSNPLHLVLLRFTVMSWTAPSVQLSSLRPGVIRFTGPVAGGLRSWRSMGGLSGMTDPVRQGARRACKVLPTWSIALEVDLLALGIGDLATVGCEVR